MHKPQHPGGVAKGLEHQLLQIHLQMHFKSFWNDLMESEGSRPSTLRGWQPYRTRLIFCLQNLTASPPSMDSDPLAIPVKKGEIFVDEKQKNSS